MKVRKIATVLFLFMAAAGSVQAATKANDGIEWPPFSQHLQDGPRGGYYPHTDAYVTTFGAPQMIKKGLYIFSIPTIWYEKNDGSVLMDEGFVLKKAKNQFVKGRVCDAVALGTDFKEGNYWWVCEADMVATDQYYFRKDDPTLTGQKVKKETDSNTYTEAEKALIG